MNNVKNFPLCGACPTKNIILEPPLIGPPNLQSLDTPLLPWVDSRFEIGGGGGGVEWYDFHGSCRGVWGHAPQESFDFGPLKMAIWCNLGVIFSQYDI